MNKLTLKIHEYLEQAVSGNIEVDDQLLHEFGERVKEKLKKQLVRKEDGFRLRMSNIGRPLRQLMLEQKYGRGKPDAEFMLKMLFGDLYESLMIYLIKASGIEVLQQDTKVSIPVQTSKGIVNVDGEIDLVMNLTGKPAVYDVKSCSPYSYDAKFNGHSLLEGDDSFGYVDQIFGYGKGLGVDAGGWAVINKSDGRIKVDEIPKAIHDELMAKSIAKIEEKVRHVVEERPMPECDGVIEESYYGKKTGNKILGPSCKFCNCKEKCHPGIQYKPSEVSKSKTPKFEWYVK